MQFLTTTTESYISLFFTLALIVLETGADRVKIRFTKNAISSVEKLNMDNAPAKK